MAPRKGRLTSSRRVYVPPNKLTATRTPTVFQCAYPLISTLSSEITIVNGMESILLTVFITVFVSRVVNTACECTLACVYAVLSILPARRTCELTAR